MQVSFDHDQDPRYRWASIYAKSGESCLIVVHEGGVSRGFTYKDGVIMHLPCAQFIGVRLSQCELG